MTPEKTIAGVHYFNGNILKLTAQFREEICVFLFFNPG